MAFRDKYKELYFESEQKRIQEEEEHLRREKEWNREKGQLLSEQSDMLTRCHTAEIRRQEAMEKQQQSEEERIKADQGYTGIYKENVNLRNNAESTKSATAKVLKNTSITVENCQPQYK